MFKRITTFALIFGALAAAPPVFAQARTACAPRDTVVSQLTGKYDEARKGAGLANANSLIEVWASNTTGSWTIIVTQANGTSCIIASGNTWLDEQIKVEAVGDPA